MPVLTNRQGRRAVSLADRITLADRSESAAEAFDRLGRFPMTRFALLREADERMLLRSPRGWKPIFESRTDFGRRLTSHR